MAQLAEASNRDSGKSALTTRIISGLILAPIALALIVAGGWWLAALVLLGVILMVREWDRITGGTATGPIAWLQIAGIVLALFLVQLDYYLAGVIALAWTAIGAHLVSADVRAIRGFWPVIGTFWIGLPCVGLLMLARDGEHGLLTVLWLMVMVWACDTGAYFAGRTIGGPKLLPSVSPKKTWAGLIGGMIAAALVGAGMAAWSGLADPVILSGVSAAVAAFSQIGDLSESAFKRHFGVKDSGDVIPGHGGVLDRVDGLLFAIIFVVAIAHGRGGELLPWF
jgi:phosphatidate cytidylyltransferase